MFCDLTSYNAIMAVKINNIMYYLIFLDLQICNDLRRVDQ